MTWLLSTCVMRVLRYHMHTSFHRQKLFILQVYLQLDCPNLCLKAHSSTTSVSSEVELLDDLLRGCHDVLMPDEA
jgi:hypothetical protein